MTMKYKLIVFDFDGTLADSFSSFLWAARRAAERHGFRAIDESMLDELRGYSGRQVMKYLGIPLWKAPIVAADMRRFMLERVTDVRLFEGVVGVVRSLVEAGIEIAVVTSSSRANVRAVLGKEHERYVKHLACGVGMFGKSAKMKQLLRTCGYGTRDVLCVGDEIRDSEAAKASGVGFIGVSWGYTTPAVLQQYSDGPLFERIEDVLELALSPPAT